MPTPPPGYTTDFCPIGCHVTYSCTICGWAIQTGIPLGTPGTGIYDYLAAHTTGTTVDIPHGIIINVGTNTEATGVVAHCRQPGCEWSWAWDPRPGGIPHDEILSVTQDHHDGQHPDA